MEDRSVRLGIDLVQAVGKHLVQTPTSLTPNMAEFCVIFAIGIGHDWEVRRTIHKECGIFESFLHPFLNRCQASTEHRVELLRVLGQVDIRIQFKRLEARSKRLDALGHLFSWFLCDMRNVVAPSNALRGQLSGSP